MLFVLESRINRIKSKKNILVSIKNTILSFVYTSPIEEMIQERKSKISNDMYFDSFLRRLK